MASILTLRRPARLFTRATSNNNIRDSEKESVPPPRDHDLQHFEDLPEWYQDNQWVRAGYRPVSHSTYSCIHSWTYLHNETANIFTHLLPAVACLALQYVLQAQITKHYPHASIEDRLVFATYLLSATVTFFLSAGYHTLMSHSYPVSTLWLRIDYIGILALILGSFFSGIYVGYRNSPPHLYGYWSMIGVLSIISGVLVLHTKYQGLKYRALRTSAFIATAMSGLAPIINGLCLYGWDHMWHQSGMPFWFLEGGFYGIGALFFATRMPESLWPGKFDIWLGSHQIFHILGVVGAMVHFIGVWTAYGWYYRLLIHPQ